MFPLSVSEAGVPSVNFFVITGARAAINKDATKSAIKSSTSENPAFLPLWQNRCTKRHFWLEWLEFLQGERQAASAFAHAEKISFI